MLAGLVAAFLGVVAGLGGASFSAPASRPGAEDTAGTPTKLKLEPDGAAPDVSDVTVDSRSDSAQTSAGRAEVPAAPPEIPEPAAGPGPTAPVAPDVPPPVDEPDAPPPAADPKAAARPALLAPSDETARPTSATPSATQGETGGPEPAPRRRGDSLYRPTDNPGRLTVSTRLQFALFGVARETGGGRAGGVAASLGQTWNFIGYGLEATLYAGQIRFRQVEGGPTVQNNLLVGGGPMLGLGRLGLGRRSMLDLQLGYAFLYGVNNPVMAGAPSPDPIAPHGPKARLDAGFQLETRRGTSLHQFVGMSIAWQGLIDSLVGTFPTSHGVGFAIFYAFL